MNRKTIKDDIESSLAHYKDHYLEPVVDTPGIKGWYVKKKGCSRESSFLVLFHGEGISIHGDMAPGNTLGSCVGTGPHYGLGWFRGSLGFDYMASKFLERRWCEARAEAHIEDMIADFEEELAELRKEMADADDGGNTKTEEAIDGLEDLLPELRSAHKSCAYNDPQDYRESFEELLNDAGYEDVDFIFPDHDYEHQDVVRLACIQRTFARLYNEKYDPKEGIT
jgi:hypothetical protein